MLRGTQDFLPPPTLVNFSGLNIELEHSNQSSAHEGIEANPRSNFTKVMLEEEDVIHSSMKGC